MSSSASGGGLPFTYVRIPADGTADVEELDGEALGYAGDALPDYLGRTRFASSGAPHSSSSGPQAAQTARVLAAASEGRSETFALVHPSSTNGSRGVYLYVDEVGKLKNAPPNARATELAERCGLEVDGDFYGDAFVGAVSVQPRTTNVSFSANELEPDAPWLVNAPSENAAYAVAMRQFRDAVDAKKVSEADRAAIEADRKQDSQRTPPMFDSTRTTPHDLTSTEGLETYFETIVSERNAPVTVSASHLGLGNGVSATRDLRVGETLWAESPLASTQTAENARAVLACASCHRSVGTIDAQLRLAAGRINALEAAALSAETDEDQMSCPFSSLPGFEAARGIPRLLTCRNRDASGCPAVYCSPECLVRHAARGHDVACCGEAGASKTAPDATDQTAATDDTSADETSAVVSSRLRRVAVTAAAAFRRDCGHHDSLALVSLLVGSIAERLKNGDDWPTATKALRGLVGGPWWDVSGEDDPETKTRLFRVAARSAALLAASARAACEAARADQNSIESIQSQDSHACDDVPSSFSDSSCHLAAARASVGTLALIPTVLERLGNDGFGHLLGTCDLNQWSVKVDGPMRNVMRELLRVDENDGPLATRATLDALLPLALEAQDRRDAEDLVAGRPRWGGDEEDVFEDVRSIDGDETNSDKFEEEIRVDETSDAEDLYDVGRRLFPIFSGAGLFPLLCLVNHSCDPCATTRYSSWKGRLMVRVEALRDVKKGEELSVSYVDETRSVGERKKALAAYGFKCACVLCVAETKNESEISAADVD